MLNKKKVILLFLGLIFLYGCTQAPTGGLPGAYDCYGDDPAMVSATFDPFAPISSEDNPYQPGEEIEIAIEMTNYFSESIAEGNAKVRLVGEAAIENIFTGASEVTATELYEIDIETCLPEPIEVEIGPIIYKGDITTKISKEISGLFCYQKPVEVKAFLYYTENSNEIGTNLPAGANPPSSVQVVDLQQNPVDVDRDSDTGDMRFKIFLQNVGEGTIIPSLGECFEYRETGFREEFNIKVEGGYNIECPETVKLSRDEKSDVVTCKVTGIDRKNLSPNPVEITITLDGFAYEDNIPATQIWLEP